MPKSPSYTDAARRHLKRAPDNTARPVKGDHIGLSELGAGSRLDQNVREAAKRRMGQIQEDDPRWDPLTMGNKHLGKKNPKTGRTNIVDRGSAGRNGVPQ